MRSWELIQFPTSFLCIERSDYEDKVEIFVGYDIETVVNNKEKNLLELIW